MENGVEYFDMQNPNQPPDLPKLKHFRSSNFGEIEFYLISKWEQCCMEVELPAVHIRTYAHNGSLQSCVSSSSSTLFLQ